MAAGPAHSTANAMVAIVARALIRDLRRWGLRTQGDTLVRRWVHAARLPPNPAPRRFAMAVAAAWSAAAGWLMSAGPGWAGVAAGSALAVAGATVALTHFCLGSWLYHLLWRR